jgi:hypothetical protein
MMEALEMGEVVSPARAGKRQVLGGVPHRLAKTAGALSQSRTAMVLHRVARVAKESDVAQVENGDPCRAFIS